MADTQGTIASFTVDRLAYSPSRRWCSRYGGLTQPHTARDNVPGRHI